MGEAVEPAWRLEKEPHWFDFLRLEVELALTFIQSAKLYSKQTDSARALNNAHKALTEVRQRLAKRATRKWLADDEIVFPETRCTLIESQRKCSHRARLRTCSATTMTKLSLRSAFVFRLDKLLCSFRTVYVVQYRRAQSSKSNCPASKV